MTRPASAESSSTSLSWGGHFIDAGGLRTHYLDLPGGDPPIVLLHGLSANAYSFSGVIAAGLTPSFRVIAPDLRGRGRTDKPASGYRMSDHARDILALLDALRLDRVVLGGHSFGAFLSIYIAAHHPERVEKLVLIDAAMTLKPQVGDMLKPSLARLARVFASPDAYLAELQAAPYVAGAWDADIEAYFRAEIQHNEDGTAQSMTSASAIAQAFPSVGAEPWRELVERIEQPAILFNAAGAYGPSGSPPLVDPEHAQEMARCFRNGRYVLVPGNHLTLVFGRGAAMIKGEIERFVRG